MMILIGQFDHCDVAYLELLILTGQFFQCLLSIWPFRFKLPLGDQVLRSDLFQLISSLDELSSELLKLGFDVGNLWNKK